MTTKYVTIKDGVGKLDQPISVASKLSVSLKSSVSAIENITITLGENPVVNFLLESNGNPIDLELENTEIASIGIHIESKINGTIEFEL